MKKADIVKMINDKYQGYEGYVQFSHRPIDKAKDIFYNGRSVHVEDEAGFIYEAHFCNNKYSVSIKQINNEWKIATTDLTPQDDETIDIEEYISNITNLPKVKMAQIWKKEKDEFCEDLKVKKLKKIVFAGFENKSKGDEK